MRLGLILLALALVACGRGYSTGDRVGVVVKFSAKGYVFKSWEGELNLGGMRALDASTVANVWAFSVRDPRVVAMVTDALKTGSPVALRYEQWMVRPISIDTDYEIIDVHARKKEVVQ
jgi:hypothetical protein